VQYYFELTVVRMVEQLVGQAFVQVLEVVVE
jgi:hypothetical protein